MQKKISLTVLGQSLIIVCVYLMQSVCFAQNDEVKEFVPLPQSEVSKEKASDNNGTRFRVELFKFKNPFKRKNSDDAAQPLSPQEMGKPIQDQSAKEPERKKNSTESKNSSNSFSDNKSEFSDSFLDKMDDTTKGPDDQLSDDISTNISTSEFAPQNERKTGGIRIGGKNGVEDALTTSSKQMVTSYVSDSRRAKVESTDFLQPNPKVENDENALSAYSMAVRYGQVGDYDKMVDSFDSFVKAYPSSRLTPRVLYLSAIYAKEPIKRQTAAISLLKMYSTSKYVNELKRRDASLTQTAMASVGIGQKSVFVESKTTGDLMQQTTDRTVLERNLALEKEILQSPSVANRLELANNYIKIKNYTRAETLLLQLRPEVQATDKEPFVLDLLSQVQMELGQMDEARINMDTILRAWPKYDRLVSVRLNMATVCEKVGNYSRALAEYKNIEKDAPKTPEAATAAARIKVLQNIKK